MTDLSAASRAALAPLLPDAVDAGPRRRLRRRRHPQEPAARPRRHAGRVGHHALRRPHHRLRLQPGRLRHGLPVLRHRPGGAHPQPVDGGDRRAGGRRAAHRVRSPAAGSATSCSWGWASRSPTTTGSWPRSAGSPSPARTASGSASAASWCRPSGWCRRSRSSPARTCRSRWRLSLHAPDDELRDTLVPVNTRWPVREVLKAALGYTRHDRPPAVDRVRPDPRRQRPAEAGRPARPAAQGQARPRQPHPAEPDPGVGVGRLAEAGRAGVRAAAAGGRRPDDGARHPRAGDRRRLRPARGPAGLTVARLTAARHPVPRPGTLAA